MAKQKMQAFAEIPPFAFHDYPVDIQLRIYRKGARYRADIFAMGQVRRVPIEMSPQDLAVLNKQLQEALGQVTGENVEDWTPNPSELEEQLSLLAEVGYYAFKKVFGHHDALAAIRELLDLSTQVSIQVTSEDFFLPWELIYPVSPEESLSYDHFWGMNYIISRVIVQSARPGAFVSPIITPVTRPRLGLLVNSQLRSVVEREVPFFEKLDKDGRIVLCRLRALRLDKKREEFKAFKDFWDNFFDLAHFACHAFYEDEEPNLSRILLSNEFPITLRDMEVYGVTISGHPLIIMNACETGNLNPLYTSHFAAAFLRYGARGVVATECAVPDAFAADFAEQLYACLLAGKPLGESLLNTRQYFLEKYHNPTGLLYSMYAPPSIRLVIEEPPDGAHLQGLAGEWAGHSIAIPTSGLTIGRARGNQVRLYDWSVSRHHARISFGRGHFYLQDQGSMHGTYVNGRRIEAVALNPRDRITIGDAEFEFRLS